MLYCTLPHRICLARLHSTVLDAHNSNTVFPLLYCTLPHRICLASLHSTVLGGAHNSNTAFASLCCTLQYSARKTKYHICLALLHSAAPYLPCSAALYRTRRAQQQHRHAALCILLFTSSPTRTRHHKRSAYRYLLLLLRGSSQQERWTFFSTSSTRNFYDTQLLLPHATHSAGPSSQLLRHATSTTRTFFSRARNL